MSLMLRLPLRFALLAGALLPSLGLIKLNDAANRGRAPYSAHRSQMIECMRVSPPGDVNTASAARSVRSALGVCGAKTLSHNVLEVPGIASRSQGGASLQ